MAKLTKKQAKYVQHRARGLSREQSAIMAGYSENGGDPVAERIEKSETVSQELARVRAETASNVGITKEMVIEMLREAADLAKLQADPTGIVQAAREMGKMLGFYAPEVKKITRDMNKQDLQKLLTELTEDELLRLANAKVIDVTPRREEDKILSDV